jgi:chromosome segregation ATPase
VCPQLPLPGLQGPSYPLTDVEGFTFFDTDIGVQTDPVSTADVGLGVQEDLLNPADLADYQRKLAQMRAADAANELHMRKLGQQHKLDLQAACSKAAQDAGAAARKCAAAAHEVAIQELRQQHKKALQAAASQAAQAATAEAKAAHGAHLQQLRQQHQQEVRAARSKAAQAATAAARDAAAEAIAGTTRLLELHRGATSRVEGQLAVAEAAAEATCMHAGKVVQRVDELTAARAADAGRHAEAQQQLAALQQQLQQAVANAAAAEKQVAALQAQHTEASARLAQALRDAQAAAAAAGQEVQRLQQVVSQARTALTAADTQLSKTARCCRRHTSQP